LALAIWGVTATGRCGVPGIVTGVMIVFGVFDPPTVDGIDVMMVEAWELGPVVGCIFLFASSSFFAISKIALILSLV
jgi:hypothetical protein